MPKKSTHGGKRKGAGRKPTGRKKQVTIFVKPETVKRHGGYKPTRKKAEDYLEGT